MMRTLLVRFFPPLRAGEAVRSVSAMADALVKDVEGRYVLDYSVTSLESVEAMLAAAAAQPGVSGTVKELLVRRTGSYVSEAARRKYGGDYIWDTKYDLPLLVSGRPKFELRLHAYEKVAKRLHDNDPADNIPFFFQGFAQHYEEGTSGDIV